MSYAVLLFHFIGFFNCFRVWFPNLTTVPRALRWGSDGLSCVLCRLFRHILRTPGIQPIPMVKWATGLALLLHFQMILGFLFYLP